MPFTVQTALRLLLGAVALTAAPLFAASPGDLPPQDAAVVQADGAEQRPTLAELKATGRERSRFKDWASAGELHAQAGPETEAPQANLAAAAAA